MRERRNRKQRARLITLLAVITVAGISGSPRYSSRPGTPAGLDWKGAASVACSARSAWSARPSTDGLTLPGSGQLPPGWPSTMATRGLAAEPETWPALSPSSSLVTTRRSPSYPYVAGPVDLAGMVTPCRPVCTRHRRRRSLELCLSVGVAAAGGRPAYQDQTAAGEPRGICSSHATCGGPPSLPVLADPARYGGPQVVNGDRQLRDDVAVVVPGVLRGAR